MPRKSRPRNHSTIAVLTALNDHGVQTVEQIHKRAGSRFYSVPAVRQTVARLKSPSFKLVRRTNGKGPGREGLYMITKKGIKYLS